jgi:hypothetical protein
MSSDLLCFCKFLGSGGDWVHSVRHQPWLANVCGAFGGMGCGTGNRSTPKNAPPPSVPLCPPQISHDLTRARNLAVAVGSRRLTARTTERPLWHYCWIVRSLKLYKFLFLSNNAYSRYHLHSSVYITWRPLHCHPRPSAVLKVTMRMKQ